MTTNLTDLSNQLALEIMDDETLDELIQFRRGTTEYHISQGNKVQAIMHNAVLSALIELQERHKAAEPVGEDELDHLIWGLERHGNLKRTLAALVELRERRKAKGEPVADVVAWSHWQTPRTCDIRWRRFDIAPGPLYAAPPAPLIPTFDEWLKLSGNKPLGWVKDSMREAYNACRDAILSAYNNHTVRDTNKPE